MIILIASISIVAYAAINYFFHLSQNVPNTRGVKIAGSWTGEVAGKAVVPGDKFQLNQTITSDSTEPVYVFVRIDIKENAYKISGVRSGWTVVKQSDNEIRIAYGTEDTMIEVAPDEEIDFEGVLTLDVSNTDFVGLSDSALSFTINACGVPVSKCEGQTSAENVYAAYVTSGGN